MGVKYTIKPFTDKDGQNPIAGYMQINNTVVPTDRITIDTVSDGVVSISDERETRIAFTKVTEIARPVYDDILPFDDVKTFLDYMHSLMSPKAGTVNILDSGAISRAGQLDDLYNLMDDRDGTIIALLTQIRDKP